MKPVGAHSLQADWNNAAIRADFPLLAQTVYGKPLLYLDNAATTQKPNQVIDAIADYYRYDNANVHRGVYRLSVEATAAYEAVREQIRQWIRAQKQQEIVFTAGTTAAINLVAYSFGKAFIKPGDEILLSALEHHSNIVPWQIMCEDRGAKIKVIPILDNGEIDLEAYQQLLTAGSVKLVACSHVSNVLGIINPVKTIIAMAHEQDIPVLIDGAQAVAHQSTDVTDLDCDFYAFSAHKMYGPTGVGVLFGKHKWLQAMPPFQGGGDMIAEVGFERSIYNELPYKFEAGTPPIADVIGLGAAVQYLQNVTMQQIEQHTQSLMQYAYQSLLQIPGLKLFGHSRQRMPVFSFTLDDIHAHDVGTFLDQAGIAVRAGHHCAQPLMERFTVPALIRASLGIYNTQHEVDQLVENLYQAKVFFR